MRNHYLSSYWRPDFSPSKQSCHRRLKWRALAASGEVEKFPEAPGALGTPEWKSNLVLSKLHGCADRGSSSGSHLRGLFCKSPHRFPLLTFPPGGTLGPPSQRSLLQLCTPRLGCGSETVLHSAHRRLPSPQLQTAARLCLCHPDPLQGNDQSYGRTCLEPWANGSFFPHRPQTDRLPGLQRVPWKRKTFLLVMSPHPVPGVEWPVLRGIISPFLDPFLLSVTHPEVHVLPPLPASVSFHIFPL